MLVHKSDFYVKQPNMNTKIKIVTKIVEEFNHSNEISDTHTHTKRPYIIQQ
jgi:hypothetical protein